MNRSTLLALLAAGVTAVACFLPWLSIESKDLLITGMDAAGTKFGKPGLLHLILVGIYLVFALIPNNRGQFANLIVAAFNTAWFIKNFLIPNAYLCAGDDCPTREYGLYLLSIGVIGMLAATLFTKSRR